MGLVTLLHKFFSRKIQCLKPTLKCKFRTQGKGRFLICVSVGSDFTFRAFSFFFPTCQFQILFQLCLVHTLRPPRHSHPSIRGLLICSWVVSSRESVSSGLQGHIHTYKPISQELLCAAKLDYTEIEILWRKQSRQESESLENTPFQKITACSLWKFRLWIRGLPSTFQGVKFFIALEQVAWVLIPTLCLLMTLVTSHNPKVFISHL